MVKEKIYRLPMSEKTKILYALAEEDYEFMAKRLKKHKITPEDFIDMCTVAIDNGSIISFKILLDLYAIYHTQVIFDRLSQIILSRKAYKFADFLSSYIDEINDGR